MLRILLLAVLILAPIMSGCKNRARTEAAGNQGAKPAEGSAAPAPNDAAPANALPAPEGPVGVYSISEVDHKVDNRNVVDMIPSHREIQFTFGSDGSFKRIAWQQGLIHLNETGSFKIDPPDQLILSPAKVNDKAVTGRQTTYKFALSSDGYELKLWGARGNVAVFHRTGKL